MDPFSNFLSSLSFDRGPGSHPPGCAYIALPAVGYAASLPLPPVLEIGQCAKNAVWLGHSQIMFFLQAQLHQQLNE